MANNGAPDSWEQQADSGAGDSGESSDLSGKFSTLNVNAAEFVPSFLPRQAEPLPNSDSPESTDSQVPVTNDAGKSTIGGQIMNLTGMVDKRTLEKYEREAKERSRETWYLSWALDTNQEGGQTREHAMLAKTAGVKHLVVLVNKMDDPTVEWSEVRFNECRDKILPYLRKLGFNPQKDLTFIPCSGLMGLGLKDQLEEAQCPWYRGDAFIPFIDSLPSLNRKMGGPFVMPVVDKYKDMGMVVMGKVEAGEAKKGQSLLLMPNRTTVVVDQMWSDDEEVTTVGPGENVKIKLKGIEEDDVSPGFVLCDSSNPIKTGRIFDAQVVILEHKSIICAGYSAVMHIHCAAEEVTVKALICLVDKKSGDKSKTRPRFVKQDQVAIMRVECAGVICMEVFKLFPQMGRFTLRDEGKTIAIDEISGKRTFLTLIKKYGVIQGVDEKKITKAGIA
uniref:Uncharacterized protein n=1 Tax=Timema cristinae TaxID=61476 RepID=A0A7R9CIS3_TIMCR|nr:unnamed protein product [Timema cristinae]